MCVCPLTGAAVCVSTHRCGCVCVYSQVRLCVFVCVCVSTHRCGCVCVLLGCSRYRAGKPVMPSASTRGRSELNARFTWTPENMSRSRIT